MACGRYCVLREGRRERERERKKRARDRERAGGERMGDGLGGGRTGITIKQPLTAHTTPEQLTEELQRRGGGGGREGGGSGLRMEERKRAASAEMRGALSSEVITVEQATGHCSSPRRPTDSYCSALQAPPQRAAPQRPAHPAGPDWVNILPHVELEGLRNSFTVRPPLRCRDFKEKC